MSGVFMGGVQYEKCRCGEYPRIDQLHTFDTKNGGWLIFCPSCVEQRIIPRFDAVERLLLRNKNPIIPREVFYKLFKMEEK